MDVLWAPWRLDYILGPKPEECVFCIPEHTDEDAERCILARGEHCFVIMNKFPYNNGHLMVTPYRHVAHLTDLTLEESNDCMLWIRRAIQVLEDAFHPQGINMGLNLGEAAGSGIAQHMHFQIVPRWNGDASFMAVFGETTVIPEHLYSTYSRLKPLFDAIA
ncbi:histidine triad (HIT) protein [Pseudodesulfovibrio mercurii]|uniref:Histidine triad (HIT) protein n=1 Tax=Pseudodesulfovibrio mercurii TaxID=641491 RepID=F0JFC4_9BACT|nr:HIT domain-containing protein [Pseudodesulfovibrio mercurii]EGB13680.1 histidine triad (HIT) protein [Pseudodesulfovibrio mercurii]